MEELAEEMTYSRKGGAVPLDKTSHQHKRQKITGKKRTCVVCRNLGKKTVSGGRIESS